MVVESYPHCLQELGMSDLDSVLAFRGEEQVKDQRGHRDVFRLKIPGRHGRTAYLKRNLKPYKKNGLISLLTTGQVRSSARQEVENFSVLNKAGLQSPHVLAWGDRCTSLWEECSFIMTEAAPGVPADAFLNDCRDHVLRRRMLEALGREIAVMHDHGIASRDLFVRHVLVDIKETGEINFTYIDLNRLDRRRGPIKRAMRARDLASLNLTALLPLLSASERLRFFKSYMGGKTDRRMFRMISMRCEYMLLKRRYAKLWNRPRPRLPMCAWRGTQFTLFFLMH